MSKASYIVDQMFNNDPFSQWLGIERVENGPGKSHLKMTVRDEMMNGFSIAHGGITYSLADSALAFAANAHGQHALSVETSIAHLKPVNSGDELQTEVEEISLTRKLGIYQIRIFNQHKELIALFKGTVYRKSSTWETK